MSKSLSADAQALFVAALSYTTGELTDCHLAKSDLHRCTYLSPEQVTGAVVELEADGWWEDRGSAWFVGGNGIGGHQYSREQVERYRAKEREKWHKRAARRGSSEPSSLTAYSNPSQANPSQEPPGGLPGGTPPGESACCDDPDLTTWGSAMVCRNCGTRAAG